MAFPETTRVLYQKNPLDSVVCQLSFPTVLRIEAETPAAFQERIRTAFPIFKEKPIVGLGVDLPPQVAALAGMRLGSRGGFEFSSDDGLWTVSLTRDFVALTTRKYRRWEEFKEMLLPVIEALENEYKPTFYSRIGLRYINVIRRSRLGLTAVDWSKLLQPYIAAELAAADLAGRIETVAHDVNINLDGPGKLHLQHGLGTDPEDRTEQVYVVDMDFYSEERTAKSDAISKIDFFNKQSGNAFRWSIDPRLHESMGPEPVLDHAADRNDRA
jgi:uncharacterized protein (TIGR04255 family)